LKNRLRVTNILNIFLRGHHMKYRDLAAILLFGALLSLYAWPLAAAETGDRTVLLQVHVPSTGG
jgi:hypothetical protein